MQIITSHNSLDFDGLAAMVAAGKLYPAAVKVFSGTLAKNVRQFMALYKDLLGIRVPREVPLEQVRLMVVVDTRNPNRLGHLARLAASEGIELHLYDHHPASPDDLVGSLEEVHLVGATTTIMVEMIRARELQLSPFEATILALGIYEDTGSLLFGSTTARDAAAVAYLLERGANLAVVANFIGEPFSGEQRLLLQQLLETVRHHRIKGMDILIASTETDSFVSGLDLVTHRLTEIEPADGVFVVVMMDGRANVVARSRNPALKVNEILAPLGGRGHERAAAATVRGCNLQAVIQTIISGLGEIPRPGLVARDIMSSPVKTVPGHTTMDEAGRLMLRYGHTGLPVVEGEQIVGVISRRDVDKARLHELGHAPVKGFMSRTVMTVSPDTPVTEIQRMMVEHDVGRVPVVEDGRMVGIVSRTDILRTLHGDSDDLGEHEILYRQEESAVSDDCRALMAERLPARLLAVLRTAGQVAERMGYRVFMVGGVVRDLLLGVPNFDIDLVVEGEGPAFADALAAELGGRARTHDRFKTALVILEDGFKIDVATARTEYYEFPAALPTVERSSIKEDLYRRDFTINTMAINLNPDRFGQLIDYFGGRRDLQAGIIRVLYNLSFVEDPTRVLRAIRFEQRYRFQIDPDTLRFARDAIDRRLLQRLSYRRIQHELMLILEEKDPVPALRRMHEIGVWDYVMPEARLDEETWLMLRRIPRVLGWLAEHWLDPSLRGPVVYILVICSTLDDQQLEAVLARFPFDRETVAAIRASREVPALAVDLDAHPDMRLSDMDQRLKKLGIDNIAYLLLRLTRMEAWERVVQYLEVRDTRPSISGHDLKRMGLPQGPLYQRILDALYRARLDGEVKTREEELEAVRTWLAEGRFDADGGTG
ncbi:MAG: CBS domain-containing protein [Syntrophomonadaceae bacterium]|nr:CBS domain-containing protein [Syntrophomonadaceae bacterium]